MSKNVKIVNELIRKMLPIWDNSDEYWRDDTIPGFFINVEAIASAFKHNSDCTCKLTKMLIYQRLALIDLFYSTNVNQMRQFGLVDLTNTIWDLCETSEGEHTDSNLAKKIKDFTNYKKNKSKGNLLKNIGIGSIAVIGDIKDSFEKTYGCYPGKDKDSGNISVVESKAESILSKYFYFIAITNPQITKDFGFPIYDSIVKKLIPKLELFLGIKRSYKMLDMSDYINALKDIILVLKGDDSDLWDYNQTHFLHFQLLDYFLWIIGKAGTDSVSHLLSKLEYKQYINSQKKILPQRIIEYKDIYNKIIS